MPAMDKVFIKFDADGKPVMRELTRIEKGMARVNARTEMLSKTSGKLKRDFAAGFAGAAVAITGAFVALSKVLKISSNLEEQTAKFNTVFKNSTIDMSKAVNTLTESYAMSTREARQYLASTQDLLKPMGILPDLAAKMSTNVTKLAADIGSFNNLPTAQVIRDIQSALVGNSETVKKYGIRLNETVIKQEAFRLGLWKGTGALDAATKAQAAFSLIQKGSKDAMGDMARTSGSFANQMKFLKARFEDIAGEIGSVFLPIATAVISVISSVLKAFKALPGPMKTIIIIAGVLTAVILVATKVVMGFSVAFSAAIWPVTAIVAAIAAVVAISIFMVKKWVIVKKILLGIWKIIRAAFEASFYPIKMIVVAIVNGIVAGLAFVVSKVVSVIKLMVKAANIAIKLIPGVKPISTAGLDAFESKMTGVAKSAVGNIGTAAKSIVRIANDAASGGKQVASGMVALFKGTKDAIKKTSKQGKKSFKGLAKSSQKNFKKVSASAKKEFDKVMAAYMKMNMSFMTQKDKQLQLSAERDKLSTDILKTSYVLKNEVSKEFGKIDIALMTEHLGEKATLETIHLAQRLIKEKEYGRALILMQKGQRKARAIAQKKSNAKFIEGARQFGNDLLEATKAGGKKTFRVYQALAVAQATISGTEAAVKAWGAGMSVGGPAAPIFAAAFTAASIAKTAMLISQITKQHPPAAEMGGIISGSNSGTILTAGERNKSEAIIPLEGEGLDRLQSAGMGGNITISFAGANLFGNDIPEKALEAIDQGLYRMKMNNNSVALGT